jgi:sugar phosphate isomerase/epimerase
MIGLSTTYYATKGLMVYESVARIVELGFNTVEFGAAHSFERGIWATLTKVKKDFRDIIFTVHNLFPPFKKKIWFNPADGLTPLNRKVVDGLFKTAFITGASLISMHPPILNEITIGNKIFGNFSQPLIGKNKNVRQSLDNFRQLMKYVSDKSKGSGAKVIVENMNNSFFNTPISSKDDFLKLFDDFPGTGMLFDVGHALQCGNTKELLGLDGNICELHLHAIKSGPQGRNAGQSREKDRDPDAPRGDKEDPGKSHDDPLHPVGKNF